MQGLICFSHLRWQFVYQRPQHLMQRASRHWPVYFREEPVDDCMDELTGFLGAPSGLARAEQALIRRADVLFTGGYSLFEHKKHQHPDAHLFPSAIDYSTLHGRGRACPNLLIRHWWKARKSASAV